MTPEKIHLDKADWLEFAPTIWTPMTGDEKLAALVAYMTGDGTARIRGKNSLQSAFYSNVQSDMQEILADCQAIGIADRSQVHLKKTRPGYADGYQLQLATEATRILVEEGVPLGAKTSQNFRVPEWVREGTSGVKRAYISALFGAEGTTPAVDRSSKSRISRSPTLSMCKKKGFDGFEYFKDLQKLLADLGIESSVNLTVSKSGYRTQWLSITKQAENLLNFYENVGFTYASQKSVLAWQWSKYLRAYNHAAKTRATEVLSKHPDETWAEIGAKIGLSKGAAYRLHKDLKAGKGCNAGQNFPHFDDWIAERWIPSLGLLRLAVTKKEDRPEPTTVWNLRVSSHDHSYVLASGANNFNSFETMSGRVYYPFDRRVHCREDVKFNPKLPIWVGVDFNIDPMSAAIVQPQTNGDLWIVDEIFLHNSNTQELCEELEKRYWRYMSQITIYPDPAGAARQHARGESDLEIFRQKGFARIKFRRKHPLIADRVNSVNRQILDAAGNMHLFVNPGCTNVVQSLEQTLYKAGSRDIDKAASMEHITDALGYCIELERPVKKIVVAGHSI